MAKLYELSAEYRALSTLDESEDVDAILAHVSEALEQKAVNIAFVLREMACDAEAIKAEEDRLYERRKAHEKRAERLREYLRANMERANITQVKHALLTLSLVQNPPAVQVLDESAVPAEYKCEKVATIVSKADILAEYKRTGEIPSGCDIQRGTSLRIK